MHGTHAHTQAYLQSAHMLTYTHAAQIHGKAGHTHTSTHKHILRNTEHTCEILQTYTEHTNPHTLQTTCS